MRQEEKLIIDGIDVFANRGDDGVVIIGPLLWQPSDGLNSRITYFMIAASDKNPCGFRIDRVIVSNDEAEELRAAVMMAFAVKKPPLVIHLCDDELHMARLCETFWPSERSTRLRKAVEAEESWPS